MPRDVPPTVRFTRAADGGDARSGWTRRDAVQTLAMTAATSLLGLGCLDGDGGATGTGAADLRAGTQLCGDKLCVDLGHPANMALFRGNGSRVVAAGDELLMLIRRSAIEVVVLSAECTHIRCTLGFDEARSKLVCPCHGCEYDLTGAVTKAPAFRPLARHESTFDGMIVMITL